MGKILRQYYDYVVKIKGIEGKNKLGIMTKISSIVAPLEPDTAENVQLFKDAVKTITGIEAPEFN